MIELLDRLEFVRDLGIDADSCASHPSGAPQPAGRRGRHYDGAAHRRPRTRAPHRNPGRANRRTRDQARGRDARHVREIHGLAVHQSAQKDERRFQATKRDVAKALLLFRHTIFALKQAKATGEDGVARRRTRDRA